MQFLQPTLVLQHFGINEGMTVAELHSGSGFFTPLLSEKVGKYGKVYALHHNADAIVEKENIHPFIIDSMLEDCLVLPEPMDCVLVLNVFMLTHPHQAFSHAYRLLKSQGKMIVIDRKLDALPVEHVSHLAGIAGFIREKCFHAGSHHFGLVFKKA